MSQHYKNHVRWSIPYHFIFVPLVSLGTAFAIYNYTNEASLSNGLLIFGFVLIGFAGGFARFFALIVQNRAARADERLRYYILTQKMLPENLKMGQILALRFASDEEFVDLVERAVRENLSPTEIKKAVRQWRGDYNRV